MDAIPLSLFLLVFSSLHPLSLHGEVID